MNLSKKFILVLIFSIFLIAIINVLAFYFLYSYYLESYLAAKTESKKEVTEQYILSLLEKQAQDEVDTVFSDIKNDVELEFFELLEKNNKKIPLDKKENRDIVINYLIKAGVAPKYFQDIIPDESLKKVISSLKDKNSLESKFFNNLIYSILIINFFLILFLILFLLYFTKKVITPISKITNKIKKLKMGEDFKKIEYNKKDEIGFLVQAINGLNSKLLLQQKIRNRLLADISHELKTPITSISCYLEGIQDGVIKLDKETLQNITEDMQRLIKLVNMIMDYEKFDQKDLKIDKKNKNLKILIQKVISQYENNLLQNKQEIKIIGNIEQKVDKNLFKQIVHNLIGNFLKYAGTGTTMTIVLAENYIIFKDDGAGTDKKEVPLLKEKFYQAKKEKTGNIEDRGIGVGLSIVSKIVKLHSWEFSISSDLGKGFLVKIIFNEKGKIIHT